MKITLYQRSEPCGLNDTITVRYDWSAARQWTPWSLRHWNLRNLTLQTGVSITRDFFRLHSTFARLYNAAASPASRLCSADSLAITGTQLKHDAGNVRFANCHICTRKCTEITITSTGNSLGFATIYSR